MAAPKLRDVRKLADSRAVFDLDVALTELPNFPAEHINLAAGGSVHAHVSFGREQGYTLARLALQAQLQATCQRCMAPMPLRIEANSPVLIVESEQEAERAPGGWETFLAPEGRLVLEALIGEELLLALPIVPLHEQAAQCEPRGTPAGPADATAAAVGAGAESLESQATVRPFADLRALLERGGKPGGGEPR